MRQTNSWLIVGSVALALLWLAFMIAWDFYTETKDNEATFSRIIAETAKEFTILPFFYAVIAMLPLALGFHFFWTQQLSVKNEVDNNAKAIHTLKAKGE